MCTRNYSWIPRTCFYKNGKCLKSIENTLVVSVCGEIINTTDNVSTNVTNNIPTKLTNTVSRKCDDYYISKLWW